MNKDEYGEIINGPETFMDIANKLKNGKSVIIGWTDEEYTHLDILFTGGAFKEDGNYLQRGIRGDDLFISIMSYGSFGFLMNSEPKSGGYIGEKLNITGDSVLNKLEELVNGVIANILNHKN